MSAEIVATAETDVIAQKRLMASAASAQYSRGSSVTPRTER